MSTYDSLVLNIIFVLLGLMFHLLERFFPEQVIDHKKELRLDLLAFFLLLLSGPLISSPLMQLYQKINMQNPFYTMPSLWKILCATILTDFCNYWIHFYMHKTNWFWRTHVHHHRIQELYWFSGLRSSFGHYAAFIFSRVTVGVLIFGLNSPELLIYFTLGLLGSHLQHTNAKLPWKWVEWLLITPRAHRLHHAENGRRMKNLGTIFSFWDKLFGTYLDPDQEPLKYPLGIKGPGANTVKEVVGI